MTYKMVRIAFARPHMLKTGGLSKDLMIQVLNLLPADATIAGFGSDQCSLSDYMFVQSDSFKEVDEGSYCPDCVVYFERDTAGTVRATKVDFGNSVGECTHNWKEVPGFMQSYIECTVCGVKQ